MAISSEARSVGERQMHFVAQGFREDSIDIYVVFFNFSRCH